MRSLPLEAVGGRFPEGAVDPHVPRADEPPEHLKSSGVMNESRLPVPGPQLTDCPKPLSGEAGLGDSLYEAPLCRGRVPHLHFPLALREVCLVRGFAVRQAVRVRGTSHFTGFLALGLEAR